MQLYESRLSHDPSDVSVPFASSSHDENIHAGLVHRHDCDRNVSPYSMLVNKTIPLQIPFRGQVNQASDRKPFREGSDILEYL